MAIERLRAEQPEETIYNSSFQITFKKLRFAQDVTVNVGQLAGRAVAQQSPVVQNGNAGQTAVPAAQADQVTQSWLQKTFGP
jgi:cytoskeletal protein RodZ